MRVFLVGLLAAASLASSAAGWAQSNAASTAPPPLPGNVTTLQAMTVSGVQPGPGLWKVSKDGHVMWVLGTLSPLPQRMQWQSQDLEQIIGQSQEVLQAPAITLKLNTGFFGKLFLLPSAYSARKNDDGKTLQQVLPAPLYARWSVLKQKYLGNDNSIERWRPIFAAHELYKKAIKANDLSSTGGVVNTIDTLAKKDGVKETDTKYQLVIDQPRQAIKSFKSSGVDDMECFSRTLDSIEHDMPAIAARANAWATGDLDTLQKLPDSKYRDACVSAVTGADFAQKLGLNDVEAKVEATWLAAAQHALQTNTQTFALLPIDELLSPNGYLSKLKAQGYSVQPPDESDDAAGAPAAAAATMAPAQPASVAH